MKQFLKWIVLCIPSMFFAQNFTETKGELQVTDDGVATYSLPIALPPSIKDVAPVISLNYASGARGGIAGQGWSLNSISSIVRTATRKDIDGFVDGVDFDIDDKLSLDGQRLLIKSGTYWATGSTYQTEYKTNTKIELQIENSHIYFIVTNTDGSRSWYGSTGNGVIQNATSPNSWYIVRHEDVHGNFITYNYTNFSYNSTNQLYITSIKFSGNEQQGILQTNEIKFNYRATNRKRIERDFIKGAPLYAFKILESIQVFTGGTLFRRYALTHSDETFYGYERVTKIQEYNGLTQASNPVIFEYNTTSNEVTRTEKEYVNNLNFSEIDLAGDFDGDGRLDFVANNSLYRKLFSSDAANAPVSVPFNVAGNKRLHFTAKTLINNKFHQAQSVVSTEEEMESINFKIYGYNSGTFYQMTSKSVLHDNRRMQEQSPECRNRFREPYILKKNNEYVEGDFNGDGLSEVLIIATENEQSYVSGYEEDLIHPNTTCIYSVTSSDYQYHILDLNASSSTVEGSQGYARVGNSGGIPLMGKQRFVADFNGDGKDDVLFFLFNQSYKIVSFRQLNQAPWVQMEVIGQGTMDKYSPAKQVLLGDYNGDGKVDFMLPDTEGGSNHNSWTIYFANPQTSGGSFFSSEGYDIVEYWPDTMGEYRTQRHYSNYYAIDVNHDGKSDLVRVWRKYYKDDYSFNNHDTQWSVSAFTNNIGVTGASGFPISYNSGVFTSNSPDVPIPIASLYRNQNSNTDLVVVRGHYNKIEYYDFKKYFDSDNRLKSVTESNGAIKNSIEYQPMQAADLDYGNPQTDFYSSSMLLEYPYVEIVKMPENYLVSKLTATVNGSSKHQDFRYRGLASNYYYGNVGFLRTARSSWYISPSDTKFWTVKNNDPLLRGATTQTWTTTDGSSVFSPIPTNILSSISSNFLIHTNNSSKTFNVLLESQTRIDYLTGVKTIDSYSYDGTVDNAAAFGLQTQKNTSYFNGTVLQGTNSVSTAAFDYDNNPTGAGNSYYIGKPKKITTSSTNLLSGNSRTSEEKITYEGGSIKKIEKKGHNTGYLIEEMAYDGVGNLLTKKISMPTSIPAVADRLIVDEYEATKRFVVKKTDLSGKITLLEYNVMGQLKKSTDPLGVLTENEYDTWGKLTETKTTNATASPLKTAITYEKFSDGSYAITKHNIWGDNAKSTEKYDVLGRIIKTTSKGFASNSTISRTVEYDALGRKYRESEPYAVSPSKYTYYEYDNYHRTKKITSPTLRITTFDFNGLTTTTIDDGKTLTETTDAMGNKIQSTDPGGAVNFKHYATGELKESDYDGNKIEVTVDGWGNKTSLKDPNAGLYNYEYDGFGQLNKEITPKGYTKYTHDDFGKVILKKTSGDGADYNTVIGYNSDNQVITETTKTTGNVLIDSFTYSYDPTYHYITNVTESNADFIQSTAMTYDPYGRVDVETKSTTENLTGQSSTLSSKYNYNAYNGIMDKLTEPATGAVLWQLNTTNEKMRPLTETLGNGVGILNEYTPNGYISRQKHSKSGTDILNNTYVFDEIKSNLSSRSNVVLGINETFTYDTLDRLETWSNPLTGTIDSNSYDSRGRITLNNSLGDVQYNEDVATGVYKKTKINLNAPGKAYYTANPTHQTVIYTMFKTPISIQEGGGKMDFKYNSHLSRTRMDYDYGTIAPSTTKVLRKTKLYTSDGSTEVLFENNKTIVKIRTFIGGDAYSAKLYYEKVVNRTTGVTTEAKFYLHRDYLGSIMAISNASGVAVEKRHFDAWGNLSKIVNASNVSLDVRNGLQLLDRGYTGHEHLQEVRLINMNGRLYDPALRSFLMPDNFVQQPDNTQNYNRYAYVFNNPLKYTDPSGEYGWAEFGTAVAIAAVVAALSYTITALVADVPFSVGGLVKNVFIGAAVAAVTYGIGTASSSLFSNFFSRAAFSAVAHGTFQGGVTAMSGGKFWSGFAAGALSSIAASAWSGGSSFSQAGSGGVALSNTGMAGLGGNFAGSGIGMITFGTVIGGGAAALTGGNFWQGALTGFVVSAFNHQFHKIQEKSLLDKAIIKAGFDPDEVARWSNEELTNNMSKIFPELYEAAECPRFEIQDIVGGKDKIFGRAQKSVSGNQGNYKVVSKGLIYIKKLALNSVRHVASVAGHELNHVADYISGNYTIWLNKYDNNARSEVKAYGWEQSMGSPYFDEKMYNHFLNLTK